MHYTETESINWSKISNFLEPQGVLDIQACSLFLDACIRNKEYYVYESEYQLETLYAVLKKTDLPQSEKVFINIYKRFRNTHATVEPFIGAMATHQPEKLKKWLQQALPELDTTSQIMVLRDVTKWLPGEDLNKFTLKKLLTTKPDVVLKKLTPAVEDMPYLLEVARQFQTSPQYKSLGDSIIKGVFIARYGKEDVSDPLEAKYSANKAFGLLQSHHVDIDAAELLRVVQLRYKAASIISDALAYPAVVLKREHSDEEEKLAINILHTTFEIYKQKVIKSDSARKALAQIYDTLSSYPQYESEKESIKAIFIQNTPTSEDPFSPIMQYGQQIEPFVVDILRAYQTPDRDPDNINLIKALYLGARPHNSSYSTLAYTRSDHTTAILRNAVREIITPQQVTRSIDESLADSYKRLLGTPKEDQSLYFELLSTVEALSKSKLTASELQALKATSSIPKMVLTYLLTASNLKDTPHVLLNNGILPNMEWQPLPLLNTLYPEQASLWNEMQRSLLKLEKMDITSYKALHITMFNMFAQAFLPTQPNIEDIKQLSDALGLSPLHYVLTICDSSNGEELHNINSEDFLMDF